MKIKSNIVSEDLFFQYRICYKYIYIYIIQVTFLVNHRKRFSFVYLLLNNIFFSSEFSRIHLDPPILILWLIFVGQSKGRWNGIFIFLYSTSFFFIIRELFISLCFLFFSFISLLFSIYHMCSPTKTEFQRFINFTSLFLLMEDLCPLSCFLKASFKAHWSLECSQV